jgi:hypothetical protein
MSEAQTAVNLKRANAGVEADLPPPSSEPSGPLCDEPTGLSRGKTMKTTREALQATEHGTSVTRGHPRERTGVRFVLTNAADSSQADDYSAWYDDYERAIIRPGLIANAFRFENSDAAGTETDPRYAALYDIVSPDPASAWPDTENSPDCPSYLFDDPRSRLVVQALRASYALTGLWRSTTTMAFSPVCTSSSPTEGLTRCVRNERLLSSGPASSTARRDSESSRGIRSRPRASRSLRPIGKTR